MNISFSLQDYHNTKKTLKLSKKNWKDNPEGDIAAQILKTSLATRQAIQFYNDKAKRQIPQPQFKY